MEADWGDVVNTRRALGHSSLLALLLAGAALPNLDAVAGWTATSYSGWPGVGASAALFLTAGPSGRWRSLAEQTVGLTMVLALTYDLAWWQGAAVTLAVTVPGMLSAQWLRPHTKAIRRLNEHEVDAYHGVTAGAGALSGLLAAAASLAAGSDTAHVLMVGFLSFLSATTAQLVLLPFWLRRPGDWRRAAGRDVELWSQRVMMLVFTALVFIPESTFPVGFLVFPVLGWAALRARVAETHVQVLAVSMAAVALTLSGRGPLAVDGGADPDTFAPLLVFLYIASLCYLLVPLALTVERLTGVTRQATGAASMVERMLDSATGTVFIGTDPAGNITHYNHGAEQALGFTASEVVGRPTSIFHSAAEVERQAAFFGIAGTSVARLYRAVVAAQIDSGAQRDWEFLRKDGERRMVSLNVSTMSGPDGTVAAYIASGEDITDRLRGQRALEKAFQQERDSAQALRAADEVKQELVSTVSHELRTPITNIAGYAELLVDGDLGVLTDKQQEAVERIERNSTRLHQLVDDLLTLASAESDALSIARVPVDLNDVVLGAHEMLATQTAGRDLDVHVALARRPVLVSGDPDLLERAVINLWSNAIKFTPDGGSITLTVQALDAAGDQPTRGAITVRDTGMGIPVADQPEVFTRFYRSAEAGELAIQGSGLGLTIVRAIVDQHDGEISLESAPGAGTTVTIAVPTEAAGPETGVASSDDDAHTLLGNTAREPTNTHA